MPTIDTDYLDSLDESSASDKNTPEIDLDYLDNNEPEIDLDYLGGSAQPENKIFKQEQPLKPSLFTSQAQPSISEGLMMNQEPALDQMGGFAPPVNPNMEAVADPYKAEMDDAVVQGYMDGITEYSGMARTKEFAQKGIEDRFKDSINIFTKNLITEDFIQLSDYNKALVIGKYVKDVVKPTREEIIQLDKEGNQFGTGLMQEVNQLLYGMTDAEQFNVAQMVQEELFKTMDETKSGDFRDATVTYERDVFGDSVLHPEWKDASVAKSINDFITGNDKGEIIEAEGGTVGRGAGAFLGNNAMEISAGIATAFIPGLGVSLLTDTALYSAIVTAKYGRMDKGMEQIAKETQLAVAINGAVFGIFKLLGAGKIDEASEAMYGKPYDDLDGTQQADMNKFADEAEFVLDDADAMNDATRGSEKPVEYDNKMFIGEKVSKTKQTARNKAGEKRELANKLFPDGDEDKINAYMKIGDKQKTKKSIEQTYKGMSKEDLERIDELATLQESPPVTAEEIEEANRIFAIGGGDAIGGAMGGSFLGMTEEAYQEIVNGKDSSLKDYIVKGLIGGAVGAKLGQKYGGKQGTKMFVGAKADEPGAFSSTVDKKTRKWVPDTEATVDAKGIDTKIEKMYEGTDQYIKKAYKNFKEKKITKYQLDHQLDKYADRLHQVKRKMIKDGKTMEEVEVIYNKIDDIDDMKTVYKADTVGTVGDVLKHEKLYDAEPFVKDIPLKIMDDARMPGFNGVFDGKEIRVAKSVADDPKELKSVILHEIQHGIQDKYKWASGGNTKDLNPDDLIETLKIKFGDLPFYKKMKTALDNGNIDRREYYENVINTGSKNMDGGFSALRFETYKRLGGEQEARAVQASLKHPGKEPYQALIKEEGELPQGINAKTGRGASTQENAPAFYSVLERTLENSQTRKMTVKQLKGYLAKQGVKAEELRVTGTGKYLDELDPNAKVNLDDVRAKVKQPEYGEEVYQDINPKYHPIQLLENPVVQKAYSSAESAEEFKTMINKPAVRKDLASYVDSEIMINDNWVDDVMDSMRKGTEFDVGRPKFRNWSTKGVGEKNYREVISTDKNTDYVSEAHFEDTENYIKHKRIMDLETWENANVPPMPKTIKEFNDRFKIETSQRYYNDGEAHARKKHDVIDKETGETVLTYNSSKTGDDLKERLLSQLEDATPDLSKKGKGEKTLHMDESQSDLHQQGRKEGYAGDGDNKRAELKKKKKAIEDDIDALKGEEKKLHDDMQRITKLPKFKIEELMRWREQSEILQQRLKRDIDNLRILDKKPEAKKIINDMESKYPDIEFDDMYLAVSDRIRLRSEKDANIFETAIQDNSAGNNIMKTPMKLRERIAETEDAINLLGKHDDMLGVLQTARDKIHDEYAKIREVDSELDKVEYGVPKAPLMKTEDWTMKNMKELIDEAVKSDYKWVTWTDGKTQAQRYSLADTVDYLKHRKNSDGTYDVSIFTKSQGHFKTMESVAPKEIADTLGKEVADDIVTKSEVPTENWHNMYNQDIPIGGKGMESYYDKMLPKWMTKYLKQYGSKVEIRRLKNGKQQLGFKVTDEMKSKIKTQGQPLYTNEMATGALYGFEENEDGTWSYDIVNGLLGAVGARIAKKALTSKQMKDIIAKHGTDLKSALKERGAKTLDDYMNSQWSALPRIVGKEINEMPTIKDITPDELKLDKLKPITLKNLEGKKVISIPADLTKAGAVYTGVDGAKTKGVDLMGGGLYPILSSSQKGDVVWANKSVAKFTALKKFADDDGYVYGVVMNMSEDTHQSNITAIHAVMETFRAFENTGKLTKVNAKKITVALRKRGRELMKHKNPKISVPAKQISKIPDFSNMTAVVKYIDDEMTFGSRSMMMDEIKKISMDRQDMPNIQKILDEIKQPEFSGGNWGDGQVVIKMDVSEKGIVRLGTKGTKKHPSYDYGVKGEVVGKLERPLGYKQLFRDNFNDFMNTPNAKGNLPKESDFMSKAKDNPLQQVIDTKLIEDLPSTAYKAIKSKRQAQLVEDAYNGLWEKNKGISQGVTPLQFYRELYKSKGSSTLDQVTVENLKSAIKENGTTLHRLGGKDSRVMFSTTPREDGGVNLNSVINNEVNAPGAGNLIMYKAIEEGVTDLNAFAVPIPGKPEGLLPAFYKKHSFEEVDRYPFDRNYKENGKLVFTNNQYNDMIAHWKSLGWDESMGMPDIVDMKWRGKDADRTGYTKRLLEGSDNASTGRSPKIERATAKRLGDDGRKPDQGDKQTGTGGDALYSKKPRRGGGNDVSAVYNESRRLTKKERDNLGMRDGFANESLLGGIMGGGIGAGVGAYNSNDKEKGALAGAVFGAIIGAGGITAWSRWATKPNMPTGMMPPETKMGAVQRKLQNKFNRVQELLEVKTNGNVHDLPDSINPVQAETLFHGRAEDRMTRFKEQIVQPLLKKIVASKYDMDDLDLYLHARHASERNARNLSEHGTINGSGLSDDEARVLMDEYDTPEMRVLAKYIDNMNEARLRMIEAEGLEDPRLVEMLRNGYENYVPLQRVMDDANAIQGVRSGKGYTNKAKEFKRAKGSQREVLSPTVMSMINYQSTLVHAEKNKVGKAILNFIEEYPDETLYKSSGVRHTPQYDIDGEVVRMNPNYQLADNVFHVKVDGKTKEIVFHDPALASAFKNLNAPQLGAVWGTMHKAIRYLASVSTSYNPEFVISNFARDIQTAMANMPHTTMANEARMVRDVLPAVKGIWTKSGEWGRWYDEFSRNGAKTGWIDLMQVDSEIAKLQKEILMLEGKAPVKKTFFSMLDKIDNINTAVENGVRLVAYRQMREMGLSKSKSANVAKELTVNFNKKGELGAMFNTMYMFANASVQGSARMLKALATTKKAKAGAIALTSTAVGLHMYNMSVNEEEYNKVPQYIKDTNLIIMKKDGTYVKMILPYGYNVFKSAGDMLGEKWTNGEVKDGVASRMVSTLGNSFNPLGTSDSMIHTLTPTLTKPLYEMENNVNFFGANIRPGKPQYVADDKPESQKYFPSVTATSKKFTQMVNEYTDGTGREKGWLDISPENMDYMIKFMGGGLGGLVMNTQTTVESLLDDKKDVNWNKVPFSRKVYGEPEKKSNSWTARDLYEKSGNTKMTKYETEQFNKKMKDGLKDGSIKPKYYKKMKREFDLNQLEVDMFRKMKIYGKPTPEQEIKIETAKLQYKIKHQKEMMYEDRSIKGQKTALKRKIKAIQAKAKKP